MENSTKRDIEIWNKVISEFAENSADDIFRMLDRVEATRYLT